MPRTNAPYPPEFKTEAVRLVHGGDRSLPQIASDLGASDQTLRNWVKQIEIDTGTRDGLTTEERDELRRLRREVRVLREEREILKKSGGLLRTGDAVSWFRFIHAEKANHAVSRLCRLVGVSRAGYYAWRNRLPSARSQADAALSEQIGDIHGGSRGTYGTPRIHAELRDAGVRCGRKRVARLLRLSGLQGCHRRKGIRTTRQAKETVPAADYLQRAFTASAPNRVWVADITYVPTWAGFLSLAVVLDVFSRRVVGWAMATGCPLGGMRAGLVVDALAMVVGRRKPRTGTIHHSDRGSQYTSLAFGQRLRAAGITASMGSRGDCYDNALMESFFATLECELLDRRRVPYARGGAYGDLRLHRGLLQHPPTTLRPRLLLTRRV